MRVLQGIILSLLIHFILVWSAQFAPRLAARLESKAIEVEIQDQAKSQNETEDEKPKGKQIVREAQIPDEVKTRDSKDDVNFLSAHDQRVKKQTRALATGKTENRSNEDPEPVTIPQNRTTDQSPKNKPDPHPEKHKTANLNPRVKGGLDAFTPKYRRAPALPHSENLAKGVSTVGEALPTDLAVGSFTALNTDRYLYYSFFSRIEDLIRYRWENSVRSTIDTTPPERIGFSSSGNWVTHLEIWLKPDGQLHSTHLMKESGVKGFDQAAIQAFIQARLFPNPPKEMVESDGLIHIKYSFEVHYEPKVLVRSSN